MMKGIYAYLFQIIMFPRDSNAFLTIDRSRVFRLNLIQKDRLKLIHSSVRE
jgi:hypothetical protein